MQWRNIDCVCGMQGSLENESGGTLERCANGERCGGQKAGYMSVRDFQHQIVNELGTPNLSEGHQLSDIQNRREVVPSPQEVRCTFSYIEEIYGTRAGEWG
jgi:hypothetical protein